VAEFHPCAALKLLTTLGQRGKVRQSQKSTGSFRRETCTEGLVPTEMIAAKGTRDAGVRILELSFWKALVT
jgi:hypothetical protein